MALITRVSRLFKADFNAVLDRIEEPSLLLQQSIREMEADLAVDEQRIKWIKLEQKQMGQRDIELAKVMAGLEEELDICLEADNSKLARTTMRRKLECERRIQQLQQQQQADEMELASLQDSVAENQQLLDSYRQKAEIFASTDNVGQPADMATGVSVISDEDIDIALLKEQQRRQLREAS